MIISIDYDEFNPIVETSYQGVIVRENEDKFKRIYTSNIVKDWATVIEIVYQQPEWTVLFSSTCDNFVMDVEGFRYDNRGIYIIKDED